MARTATTELCDHFYEKVVALAFLFFNPSPRPQTRFKLRFVGKKGIQALNWGSATRHTGIEICAKTSILKVCKVRTKRAGPRQFRNYRCDIGTGVEQLNAVTRRSNRNADVDAEVLILSAVGINPIHRIVSDVDVFVQGQGVVDAGRERVRGDPAEGVGGIVPAGAKVIQAVFLSFLPRKARLRDLGIGYPRRIVVPIGIVIENRKPPWFPSRSPTAGPASPSRCCASSPGDP